MRIARRNLWEEIMDCIPSLRVNESLAQGGLRWSIRWAENWTRLPQSLWAALKTVSPPILIQICEP